MGRAQSWEVNKFPGFKRCNLFITNFYQTSLVSALNSVQSWFDSKTLQYRAFTISKFICSAHSTVNDSCFSNFGATFSEGKPYKLDKCTTQATNFEFLIHYHSFVVPQIAETQNRHGISHEQNDVKTLGPIPSAFRYRYFSHKNDSKLSSICV